MRFASAAAMKGKKCAHPQEKPREGSKIRAIYDLYMQHKGKFVPHEDVRRVFSESSHIGNANRILVDFYGLDIRAVPNPDIPHIKKCWRSYSLVGEWCGRVYIDYTQPLDILAGSDINKSAVD